MASARLKVHKGHDVSKMPNRPLVVLIAILLATILAFVILVFSVHGLATVLVQYRGPLATPDRLQATNEARTSVIQLLAGLGLLGGLIFTARTYLLSRDTQRTDRFAKAVEQIGNRDSEAVRAGGVYALWLLARQDDQYWPVIEDVLSALVRERGQTETRARAGMEGADLQAALAVLGRRPRRRPGEQGLPLNLRGVDISGLNLVGANLERASLDGARLNGAKLIDAHLAGASLRGACLMHANLASADLTNADLTRASLQKANVYRATMTGTELADCDLSDVENFTDEQLASTSGVPTYVNSDTCTS